MKYPKVTKIIEPEDFRESIELQIRIIDEKMIEDYAKIMFVCFLLLTLVVMF